MTYDAGAGSTTLKTQKVEAGKYVVLPMLQTSLPGYEFIGWSTDPPTGDGIDDRTPISTEHLQIDSSITLYAVYHDAGITDPDDPEPEEPEYSVTFDPNGGDTTYPVQKVTSGDKVSEPVSPLKDGCIFLGWAEVGKTEPYDFNRPVEYTMVLYAMWDEFFTISYAEDDEGAPVVIVTIAEDYRGADKIEVYWGSPLIQNTIVENGTAQMVYTYTTYGYIVLTATINGDQYTSRAPFSVSADHYNPTKVYTVYFNTDGGSYIKPQKVEHGPRMDSTSMDGSVRMERLGISQPPSTRRRPSVPHGRISPWSMTPKRWLRSLPSHRLPMDGHSTVRVRTVSQLGRGSSMTRKSEPERRSSSHLKGCPRESIPCS